jgi:DNA-binding XRE family transcriptional regulator
MENLILCLELCHIFAQEFHVIYILENIGLSLFFHGLWGNYKKYTCIYIGRRVNSPRKNALDFLSLIHHQLKLKPHTDPCNLCH